MDYVKLLDRLVRCPALETRARQIRSPLSQLVNEDVLPCHS